jgi:hypothetical protein
MDGTPAQQLAQAVQYVRNSRHRHDCRCGRHEGVYCTATEKLWSTAVDRLLDQVRPLRAQHHHRRTP